MIPIIPIVAFTAIGAGVATLVKYNNLSQEGKNRANSEVLNLAKNIAIREFNRELALLTKAQEKIVIAMARKQLLG